MNPEEYFFYEWLIIEKGITTNDELIKNFDELKAEYIQFSSKVNIKK